MSNICWINYVRVVKQIHELVLDTCTYTCGKEIIEFIEILKVILFGIIEGITEWLPVSSTGHIILTDAFLPLNVSESFKEMFDVVIWTVLFNSPSNKPSSSFDVFTKLVPLNSSTLSKEPSSFSSLIVNS